MLFSHLKIAFRNLWKNKTFTCINLTGLALGISCGLGIFMIVRHEMSYDRFHPNHEKIFRVVSEFRYNEGNTEYQSGVPLGLPEAMRQEFPQVKHIAGLFGGYNNQVDIIGENRDAAPKRFKIETGVFYTTPAFFDIFNFKWIAGDPSILANPNQAAITKDLAEQYFGSWKDALGKMIQKDNNERVQINGIIDEPPTNTDLPIKLVISSSNLLNSKNGRQLVADWGTVSSRSQCFIELKDKKQAESVSRALLGFRDVHLGKNNKTDFYTLQPLADIHFNDRYGNFNRYTINRSTLVSLSLIGAFLLGLACINFINLATAQASRRSKEVGIRKVLGSRRWQLALQFMGETLLLVLGAGILSIVLLNIFQPFTNRIVHETILLNPLQSFSTLIATFSILLVVTILAGFYPALIISGFKPIQALKNKISARTASGVSLRRVLVVAQFMIAQGLIFSTLIVMNQLKFFQNAPIGFDKEAIVNISLPRDSVNKLNWKAFRDELASVPGVQHVSLGYSAPSAEGRHTTTFRYNQSLKDEPYEIGLNSVDTSFFQTYKLGILAGRVFRASDTAQEVVINETLMKKLGISKPEQAINNFIVLDKIHLPVVGVVKDFNQGSLRSAILPMVLISQNDYYRIASVKFNPTAMGPVMKKVEKLYGQYFPAYIFDYNFLDEAIAKFYSEEKKLSNLSMLFAGIGIFISCIGLYGLILFMTIQRIKEVGIRKVLGASVYNIILLFCREFMWLVLIAFVIAISIAGYFMSNWLNDFAYHIRMEWWMFGVVGFGSLLLAMLTVSFQTIKSALANPVSSLRSE